jgi:hypothetical protein
MEIYLEDDIRSSGMDRFVRKMSGLVDAKIRHMAIDGTLFTRSRAARLRYALSLMERRCLGMPQVFPHGEV